MKIEIASLRLVGCGPFDDVTLDFCDKDGKPKKTILLAGANGSGKTTVLEEIISIFEHMTEERLDESAFQNGFAVNSILPRSDYVQIEAFLDNGFYSVYFGDKPKDAKYEFPYMGYPRFNSLFEEASDYSKDAWESFRKSDLIQKMYEQEKGKKIGIEPEQGSAPPSILYFSRPRKIKVSRGATAYKEKFQYNFTWRNPDTLDFQGSLASYIFYWSIQDNQKEYNSIIEFLNNLEIIDKKFAADKANFGAIVVLPNGKTHSVDEMSSGEQNLFIILLELRRRLTHGSIVMIDEVEESLHPAYQYKLIYALQKLQAMYHFQLIMTTHSLDILDAVGPGNTLFLTDYSELKVELTK